MKCTDFFFTAGLQLAPKLAKYPDVVQLRLSPLVKLTCTGAMLDHCLEKKTFYSDLTL